MADPTTFSDADPVEIIARRLIANEEEFARLKGAFILYRYTNKAPKIHGHEALATAEVVSGKNANLYWAGKGEESCETFFRIIVWEVGWNQLDMPQKEFVIRHELRHCVFKPTQDSEKEAIRPHDFELFEEDLDNPVMPQVCSVWKRVQKAASLTQITFDLDEKEGN